MTTTCLLVCDSRQSVLRVGQEALVYTAHGYRPRPSRTGLPGFNGVIPEPATGHYLLGNGYRAYNPTLMRFQRPDSWSPFGRGGLNTYAYCLGDPVNQRDPTGHFPVSVLLGGLGFAISALTVGGAAPLALAGMLMGGAAVSLEAARELGAVDKDSTLGTAGVVLGMLSVGMGWASAGTLGLKLGRGKHLLGKVAARKPAAPGAIDTPMVQAGDSLIKNQILSVEKTKAALQAKPLTEDYVEFLRDVALGRNPNHKAASVLDRLDLMELASSVVNPKAPAAYGRSVEFLLNAYKHGPKVQRTQSAK